MECVCYYLAIFIEIKGTNERMSIKPREMDAITRHFNRHFKQKDCMVFHPVIDNGYHIDILLYRPNIAYPFWKMVTLGASDYKMPKISNTLGLYNEYIMFVDKDVDLSDEKVYAWYHKKLLKVATYAYHFKTHVTYSHSFEWENNDPNDEMIGAFLEFPLIIKNENAVQCRVGLFKKIACLQVVLLNKEDLSKLKKIGRQAFSYYLYPENGNKQHFLSERHRSEKF